jgi:hypothetical protein
MYLEIRKLRKAWYVFHTPTNCNAVPRGSWFTRLRDAKAYLAAIEKLDGMDLERPRLGTELRNQCAVLAKLHNAYGFRDLQ